jgi:hypothetical protein
MKIWLDDVRKAPDDSWYWLDNPLALDMFVKLEPIEEISLDFDMGPDDESINGLDVLVHLDDNNLLRPLILGGTQFSIHSQNPVGAQRMRYYLQDIYMLLDLVYRG